MRFLLCLVFLLIASDFGSVCAQNRIDFTREIQPILAEHCYHCHGVDASSRQGGLRLDDADSAKRGGDSKKGAVTPGRPLESHLLARVLSTDPDEMMPPPSEKKPLSPQQIQRLKEWIEEGAPYAVHWAFNQPTTKALSQDLSIHPIDQLVRSELAKKGLSLSPKEKSNVLCRRIYLDVLGLPPSPAELDQFEADGLEKTLDKLFSSERFGEKWARTWLDVARYSDTNGYEKDLRRDQWIWRDWVVDAFNRDMPYNQFLIEQLAGDLLPDRTQSQWIATGFLRNSMLNEEGAIVAEQFRMFEMFDRMDCIGKAILGLTTQCAQCHNHKFDPLTQDNYYGMLSCINNAYESQSWVYSEEQLQKRRQTLDAIEGTIEKMRKMRPSWREEIVAWGKEQQSKLSTWTPVVMHQLESISGLNHPVQLIDRSILMLGHTSGDIFFVGSPDLKNVTGVQLEILNHDDLPFSGPGRSSHGTWDISEFEVFVQPTEKSEWEKQRLVNASADFSEIEQKGEGKKATGPVAFLIDGTDDTRWQADRGVGLRNQPSVAVLQFEKPLEFPSGSKIKFVMRMGKMVGCCRISLTSNEKPAALPIDHAAMLALRAEQSSPSSEAVNHDLTERPMEPVFRAWAKSIPEWSELNNELQSLWANYPAAMTSVLHLKERQGMHQRVTHRLDRGEWDRPKQAIEPHTPSFLHRQSVKDPQASEPMNRLAFAKWLASDQSPLTSRVAVNRVWQSMFGEGLVETSEDFGTRAPVPEHMELLDWLANDFVANGWSHKKLIRTIVASETYQQSSHVTPMLLEKDPRNRWLARGPRFRCDAEVIRDMALTISGLVHHRLGGPSVIPPVPQNVLDYNYVYPSYWTPAQGPERYRRTLYGFRKRSMPDPVMSNFDGPNGDMACARRIRSNTPLAALTGLNEPVFVESAQGMANRILREGGATDVERVEFAYRLCTARLPTPQERQSLLQFLTASRQRIAEGWLNAREIATGDAAKLPSLPSAATPQDAAAWTLASRVLLNLDETISKN